MCLMTTGLILQAFMPKEPIYASVKDEICKSAKGMPAIAKGNSELLKAKLWAMEQNFWQEEDDGKEKTVTKAIPSYAERMEQEAVPEKP